jgi:hypothetical protein
LAEQNSAIKRLECEKLALVQVLWDQSQRLEAAKLVVKAAEAWKKADEDAANLAGVGAYTEEDERVYANARSDLAAALRVFLEQETDG